MYTCHVCYFFYLGLATMPTVHLAFDNSVTHLHKCYTIISAPKKSTTTGLYDHRVIALTYIVFDRLLLGHLKDIAAPLMDALQFAYRANRSVDEHDTASRELHWD